MKLVITYCTQLKLLNFIFFSKHLKNSFLKKERKKYIQRASLTFSTNRIKFVFHMNLDYLVSE